jgi:hypothetical protein
LFSNLSWPVCAGTEERMVTTASLGHETIYDYRGKLQKRKMTDN